MASNVVNNNFLDNLATSSRDITHDYGNLAILIFLVLYASIFVHHLPYVFLEFFNNWLVKILLFCAIIYISIKNVTLALVVTIAVLVTLMIANQRRTLHLTSRMIKNERFVSTPNDHYTFYDDHPYHHHHFDDDNYELDHDYDNRSYSRHNIKDAVRNKLHELKARYSDKAAAIKASTKDVPVIPSQIKADIDLAVNRKNIDKIIGILDEKIAENDIEFAGTEHAVTGGAITSIGGPSMPSRTYSETTEQAEEATPEDLGVSGVEEGGLNGEFLGSYLGSYLDETLSMINPLSRMNRTTSEERTNTNCN